MRKKASASAQSVPWPPWRMLALLLNWWAIACIELEEVLVRHYRKSSTNSTRPTGQSFGPRATSAKSGEPGSESVGITTGSDQGGTGDH